MGVALTLMLPVLAWVLGRDELILRGTCVALASIIIWCDLRRVADLPPIRRLTADARSGWTQLRRAARFAVYYVLTQPRVRWALATIDYYITRPSTLTTDTGTRYGASNRKAAWFYRWNETPTAHDWHTWFRGSPPDHTVGFEGGLSTRVMFIDGGEVRVNSPRNPTRCSNPGPGGLWPDALHRFSAGECNEDAEAARREKRAQLIRTEEARRRNSGFASGL